MDATGIMKCNDWIGPWQFYSPKLNTAFSWPPSLLLCDTNLFTECHTKRSFGQAVACQVFFLGLFMGFRLTWLWLHFPFVVSEIGGPLRCLRR